MFACLVRRAPIHGVTYYIEGMDLLRLLQRAVNEKKARTATVGEGEGNLLRPWRLKTADAWLGRAVKLPKNQENYLIVGGRLIKRSRDQYINDEGPAWRAGHEGALPLSDPGATAIQTGPSPNNLKAFQGEAPTYRAAAQHIVDPNKVLPGATARREAAYLPPAESWMEVGKQPLLVSTMRSLLKGEPIALFVKGKVNKDYSRLQTALPVLVVAMFLAEPARNARAFPINLMLLDLAQRGVYTLDKIFWHPHALNVDKAQEGSLTWNGLLPIPGGEAGPTSKEDRNVVPLANRGQLHLVGGVMPASPTGGGELAKTEALPGKPGGKKPVFEPDYIHAKEASVLLRWLQWGTYGNWKAMMNAPTDNSKPLPYGPVAFSDTMKLPTKLDGADTLQSELRKIDDLIRRRMDGFDSMP